MTDLDGSGYRRLAAAVLRRAIEDAQINLNSPVYGEARAANYDSVRWLRSNAPDLVMWCAWLNLTPEQLRQKIAKGREALAA